MKRENTAFVFIFIFSLANFSNPLTFKHINDEDIANVERLVQTKTLQMLEKNTNESILGMHTEREADVLIEDDVLKEYFGDVYYNDPHNFEFLPGDKKLIKLLVGHVQKNVDKTGENKGLRNYKPKPSKKKIIKKHMQINKENMGFAENIDDYDADIDSKQLPQLKTALFNKVMDYMRMYNVNEIVDLENVSENIVSVSSQNKNVNGHVYCIVCQNDPENINSKPKRVSYNNGCWIPSNFASHLKSVHKLTPKNEQIQHKLTPSRSNKKKTEKKKDEIQVEDIKRAKIEYTDDAAEQIWFDQISKQITAMTRAVHENGETQGEMQFLVDDHDQNSLSSLKTVNSLGDGNCMLASSAHQVLHCKMNSPKLKTAYKKLRADVVQYIKQNFDSFKNELKGHVYDIKDKNQQFGAAHDSKNFDVEKECFFFLNNLLPKNRCWTGSETLKALSIICKVNIIVIYEEGPVNVVSNFQQLYDKTIILAYRLAQMGTQSRNHYDSVTDIEPDVIYSLAQQVSKQTSKQ